MDTLTLAVMAVSFAAGILRGFAGFGTPLFLAPLYVALYGASVMVPLVLVIEVALSIFLVPRAWREADLREILPLWLGTVAAIPLGIYALTIVDPAWIKRLVAAVVLAFALANLAGWRYAGPRGRAVASGFGAIGGVLAGLIGFAGPPAVMFLLSSPAPMGRIRANLIVYFAGSSLAAIVMLTFAGLFTRAVADHALLFMPLVLLGAWAGARLYRGAGDAAVRQAGLWLLLAAGISGLVL